MTESTDLLDRIITSGRNVPEKAAIDLAIKEEIPWSGWANETFRYPGRDRHQAGLKPLQKSSLYSCAQRNLIDSDGTLFFTQGDSQTMRTDLEKFAKKRNHPWLAIDLSKTITFQAARESASWIHQSRIRILNITGDSGDNLHGEYQTICDIIETALKLILVEQGISGAAALQRKIVYPAGTELPKTVPEVVDLLLRKLSLRDRVRLGRMDRYDLKSVYFSLGEFIRNELGIWENNKELVHSCEALARKDSEYDEDACVAIIHELWKRLQKTHRIRRVK